jgi:hypothetical protein
MLKLQFVKRVVAGLSCLLFGIVTAAYGQTTPAPAPQAKSAPAASDSVDFLRLTDEVMAKMSKILGLAQLEPLKKSLRSREEIRAYVIQQMKEDKEPEKRYADQRMLEKLGLLPKDFPFDNFLVDLLTEQIAGLYDPKAKEFYIASWMKSGEQEIVMAHELTHALQDQHYHLDPWRDAAKPNDDAEAARDAVLEGSATAAMIDYGLREQGTNLDAVAGTSMKLSTLLGEMDSSSPLLMKAPAFLRDSLVFPYGAGADFCMAIYRARGGWSGFDAVFQKPPVSTQQILHPGLYFRGVEPLPVNLPDLTKNLPSGWKALDSNIMGEFGLQEVLKQFLPEDRVANLAPVWAGDRYTIYEKKDKKDGKETREDLLVFRVATSNDANAALLFSGLSDLFDHKYAKRENLVRRPNFVSFHTDEGGVFLRCVNSECVSLEGGDLKLFDALVHAMDWPPNPPSSMPATSSGKTLELEFEFQM